MAKQNYLYAESGGSTPKPKQAWLNADDVQFLVIDEFAGFGGTSTGFDESQEKAIVIAAINHDEKAITSHWLNHPEVEHYNEDITRMYGRVIHGILFKSPEMMRLIRMVEIYRAFYPNAKLILWASLECTNFSKAKGGQPRDADSRALAEHMDRYIDALEPDYFKIENVVEFMSWGPLRIALKKRHKANQDKGIYANSELKTGINKKTGKEEYLWVPESKYSGKDFLRWCDHIKTFGYRQEWRQMNSANYGAYTSRNRLFGCFAKPSLPIVWPESTHAKVPVNNGLFGVQKKWKAVKEVLDFTDEGVSIFNRKKPLVDASLERIYAGLVKFVAGGKEAFILKYNSSDGKGRHSPPSVDEPCPTVACQNRLGIVHTSFIAKYYSGRPADMVSSVESPASTVKCRDGQSLIQCEPFLAKTFSGRPEGKVISVDGPAGTITTFGSHQIVNPKYLVNYNHSSVTNDVDLPDPTLVCKDKLALVNPSFLAKYHSTGENINSVDEPASTLSTKDRLAKVQPVFFDKTFSGNANIQSIDSPAGTVMPNDKHRLINCQPFILNPSHGGHTTGTEVPCVTIVARQDKAPLYLVKFDMHPNVHIPIYEDDSEVMVRIKEFMALYGLSDIKMRMLKVSELLPIQGFPVGYKMVGNQTDHKKMIGNSVVPHVVKCWAEALGMKLREMRSMAA